MVASRDVSGKPHRSSVSASVAIVPASGRGGEYRVHGIYQRECDAACGELRRQRGGRIESGDSYKFYAEGVTPAVARASPTAAMDHIRERARQSRSITNSSRKTSRPA